MVIYIMMVNILLIMVNDDGYYMVHTHIWLVVSTYPSEK